VKKIHQLLFHLHCLWLDLVFFSSKCENFLSLMCSN
jgi:hypothetical protein